MRSRWIWIDMMRLGKGLCALIAACGLQLAMAESGPRPNFEFTEPAPWKETEKTLPPYPNDEDLLPVQLSAGSSSFEYFIDAKTLSSTSDDVVSYTLVLSSNNGAKNVMREGIRCGMRQYKTYAYGSGDGVLQAVQEPSWQKIVRTGPLSFRNDLYNYYLCNEFHQALQPKQIIDRLKHPHTTARP